jgi:hypothetical protein
MGSFYSGKNVGGAGCPDRANFRPMGVFFTLGSFIKITEGAQNVGLRFRKFRLCINSDKKKLVGLHPGVDVMITIFCDFSQFSAKKLAFFINTNVMIKFFQNLALF